MDDKTYKMTHAAAYESNFDGEQDVYMVVLSNQPIRPEQIKKVKDGEKNGDTYDYPRPFMKLEFTKDGKLLSWSGGAGNHSAGRGTLVTKIKSELKISDGLLSGSASQPTEKGAHFQPASTSSSTSRCRALSRSRSTAYVVGYSLPGLRPLDSGAAV